MADIPIKLPTFQAVLRQNNHGLSAASWSRYQRGKLPESIVWLIENPPLLRALAADAEAKAETQNEQPTSHMQEAA